MNWLECPGNQFTKITRSYADGAVASTWRRAAVPEHYEYRFQSRRDCSEFLLVYNL